MRNVDTKAVITVRMKLPIFSAGMFLNVLEESHNDITISIDNMFFYLETNDHRSALPLATERTQE